MQWEHEDSSELLVLRERPDYGVDNPAETNSGVEVGNVAEQGLCTCGAER